MKILEVRDGFIKFEADKDIYLSSFIKIDGIEKSYIAQVIQLKRSGENAIGYAKILFLYNGALLNYDKTLPSKDSEIMEFTSEILTNSINADYPVIAGKTPGNRLNITIDASAFNKKMLISADDKEAHNILARNFTRQFNNLSKNVVIIDTLGFISAKKYTAGVDFKLPLDTASLAFMYEDCLNDATADSKSLIIEIFRDLAEYSKTVPFVPFNALKAIVDDMVDKSHVFKLLVLKNKLAKFDKLGYFGKNKQEVDSIKNILNSKCTIIDLSKLDSAFQNRYLSFIYDSLKEVSNTQVFLELSNVVSKKNIKDILSNENISTTFITHSKFKYLNDIKNVFDNFIIEPSFSNNQIFSVFSTFLKAMPKDSYLIAGEAANYIPLVSSLEIIEDIAQTQNNEDDSSLEEISQPSAEVSEEKSEDFTVKEEVEEIPEEILEENKTEELSDEDILANIEDKSDEIITKAAQDLVIPENINMFEDDDISEGVNEGANEGAKEGKIKEEIEGINERVNRENTEETNISSSDSEINNEVSEITIEELDNETYEETTDELAELNTEEEFDEIPLTESFETEVHSNQEITDYVPQQELQDYEEVSIVQEIENDDNLLLEQSDESEETSIELDDDIDLDIDNEENEAIIPPVEESQQNSEPEKDIEVLPISDNDYTLDEIVELNPEEADENDIVIDMEDDEDELPIKNLDEQIVRDVDKVFTTRKDDDISDSDLDLIDELNSDDEVLLEEVAADDNILEEISDTEPDGILEESQEEMQLEEAPEEPEILETRNSSTPIVPVYDADIPQEDLVISDPIQQGDTVTHAKYGTGVVEKMIKYGSKTLFSINFDNIGRRLLDPTLTEIKKS